jgi:CMP-N-acetylneuraminate monooxygenase
MEICIGPKSILENVPKIIELDKEPYILSKDNNGNPILYSAICPHQHNVVKDLKKDVWRCPSHEWIFNPNSGNCINVPSESLKKIKIEIKENFLYTSIKNQIYKKIEPSDGLKIAPKITVVGSAALLIEWEGFNILTDPWIERLAVFDSWINYPPSKIKISNLPKIDAIFISHEHSDHFHEYTLSKLDKNIPIYVPDFDQQRLVKKAKKIGFKNIHSMSSGKIFKISNKIKAISFASGSIWNDSILYLELDNFKILNINDAGYNWNIKKVVNDIDLVCIQFGPASAYPITWTHIDNESKHQMMIKRNEGMLRMIKQIVDVCDAKYVLPFANFNELCNPEHLKYVKIQPKNRPNDVVEFFKDEKIQVLDLLPGESWNGKTQEFNKNLDRDKVFQDETIWSYLKNQYEIEKNRKNISEKFTINHKDIKKYFEAFSGSELSKKIGKYTISLTVKNLERELYSLITFENGNVSYESLTKPKEGELVMICPGNMIQEIIHKDLYWDEIESGYWCMHSRNPDIYNVAFWKLLHTPWQARKEYSKNLIKNGIEIKASLAIADIIEKGGDKVSQIFEKYGLFCVGCEISIGETIEEGCHVHGLTDIQINELMMELKGINQE